LAVRWQRAGVGMSSSFLPSGGRLLAADGEHVYAASGFGEAGFGESQHTVSALDRNTGETRWTLTRAGPPFLQGVVDGVVLVNEQYNVLIGVDGVTGSERRTTELSSFGLNGYGATVNAVNEGVAAVGVTASGEGSTQPPVITGIDPTNGQLRWRAILAPGTDLNHGTPIVVDGAALFLSTLSHPGSAPRNMMYAVDLSDGTVRWSVELGGGQGFHGVGAVVSRGGVHIPGPGALITVDPANGTERWRREAGPLPAPAVVGNKLVLLTGSAIVVVDPVTGQELSYLADARGTPGDHVSPSLPDKPVVLAIDRRHGRGIDVRNLATTWSQDWPALLVDVPLLLTDALVVATGDRGVTVFEIHRPSAPEGTAPPPTVPQERQTFTGEWAQVVKAVDTWLNADTLDGAVSAIEDGEKLRDTIKLALQRAPGPLEPKLYSGRVDDVDVVAKNDAVIAFSIFSTGPPSSITAKVTSCASRRNGRSRVRRCAT
jgi:outer membrane protein assembly factor BamB